MEFKATFWYWGDSFGSQGTLLQFLFSVVILFLRREGTWMADEKDTKAENPSDKPAEDVQAPKKKVVKPLNPLGAKPGQNYGTTKFKE
jgi:hypothetical protein